MNVRTLKIQVRLGPKLYMHDQRRITFKVLCLSIYKLVVICLSMYIYIPDKAKIFICVDLDGV